MTQEFAVKPGQAIAPKETKPPPVQTGWYTIDWHGGIKSGIVHAIGNDTWKTYCGKPIGEHWDLSDIIKNPIGCKTCARVIAARDKRKS